MKQVSDTGHEIVLYRIPAGDRCVLTTAPLLAFENHSAEGISQTDIQAAAVPRDVFDDPGSRPTRSSQLSWEQRAKSSLGSFTNSNVAAGSSRPVAA